MKFDAKKYRVTEDGDKVSVHDVEIFELGKHKGVNFDAPWFDRALGNFNAEKKRGFLPSAIIGHNTPGQERPAKGFLDNIHLKGKTVLADITKVPKDFFEKSLKNQEYPNRSVEVDPKRGVISALALLGSNRPHFKFPQLAFAENDEYEMVQIDFSDDPSLMDRLFSEINRLKEMIPTLVSHKENYTEDPEMKMSEEEKRQLQQEGETAFITKFREEHGMTPAEFAEEEKKRKDAARTERKSAIESQIAKFAEDMKTKGIAPAFVDGMLVPLMKTGITDTIVNFGEEEINAYDGFVKLGEELVKRNDEDTLFVDASELARHVENQEGHTRFDDLEDVDQESNALLKRVKAFQQKHPEMSFAEALDKVTATL